MYHNMLGDLSELVPPAPTFTPSLYNSEPRVIDYVQLPCHIWVPEFFYPHLVSYIPCISVKCSGHATRQRWNPSGPRVVHGIHSAVYLLCWQYRCHTCNTLFAGWDNDALAKLPPAVRARFRFVLTHKSAITKELHQRVIDARVHGGSLKQLVNELTRNRHNRMHETITAYYRHCEYYKLSRETNMKGGSKQTSLIPHFVHTQGAPQHFSPLRPELQPTDLTTHEYLNGHYYFDHPAPTVSFLGRRQHAHATRMAPIWMGYTQQLYADRVCIDATFKVPKKLTESSYTRLWSMMDVETGCILTQQMLTHEAHEDVLPMLMAYRQRCRVLNRQPPSRVCSDRGLMDARVLKDTFAFPDAHIQVDPWHFNELFKKTLNKSGDELLWRDVHTQFNRALYCEYTNKHTGVVGHRHAEPEHIINTVNNIIKTYSNRGPYGVAVITKATEEWWAKQIEPIRKHRILSNPRPDDDSPGTMASSMLENYHRHLNRLLKVVKFTKDAMHCFLGEFMFRWNTDRRRERKLEHDWKIYDVTLLHSSYEAAERVLGRERAEEIWPMGVYYLPEPLIDAPEEFGLIYGNVSLEARMAAASSTYPFSTDLIDQIVEHFLQRTVDDVLSTRMLDQPTATYTSSSSSSSYSSSSNDNDNDNDALNMELDAEATASLAAAATTGKAGAAGVAMDGAGQVVAVVPLPPVLRLNMWEKKLLSSLMTNDGLKVGMIQREQWNFVAARWNSMVNTICTNVRTRTSIPFRGLHTVTGDIIHHEIINIQRLANKEKWTS